MNQLYGYHDCMLFSFSRAMGSRIMGLMPNLRLLMAVIPKQHLLLEAIPSNNSSMVPPMASQHQVS